MDEKAYASNSIAQAATKAPSELERLDNALNHQADLLMMLAERLRPVTHSVPQEDSKDRGERSGSTHISTQVDRVQTHNQALQYVLDTLAV